MGQYETEIEMNVTGTVARGLADIAASIAALLHIQAPNGSIGKPISEVLK